MQNKMRDFLKYLLDFQGASGLDPDRSDVVCFVVFHASGMAKKSKEEGERSQGASGRRSDSHPGAKTLCSFFVLDNFGEA